MRDSKHELTIIIEKAQLRLLGLTMLFVSLYPVFMRQTLQTRLWIGVQDKLKAKAEQHLLKFFILYSG